MKRIGNRDFKEILLHGQFRDKAAGKKKEANVKLLLVRLSKSYVYVICPQLFQNHYEVFQYLPLVILKLLSDNNNKTVTDEGSLMKSVLQTLGYSLYHSSSYSQHQLSCCSQCPHCLLNPGQARRELRGWKET